MLKTYRCGYCGTPTDEGGTPLNTVELEKLTDEMLNEAELVHGYCCAHEFEPEMVMVTHEMAMDACMPEIEGTMIQW